MKKIIKRIVPFLMAALFIQLFLFIYGTSYHKSRNDNPIVRYDVSLGKYSLFSDGQEKIEVGTVSEAIRSTFVDIFWYNVLSGQISISDDGYEMRMCEVGLRREVPLIGIFREDCFPTSKLSEKSTEILKEGRARVEKELTKAIEASIKNTELAKATLAEYRRREDLRKQKKE